MGLVSTFLPYPKETKLGWHLVLSKGRQIASAEPSFENQPVDQFSNYTQDTRFWQSVWYKLQSKGEKNLVKNGQVCACDGTCYHPVVGSQHGLSKPQLNTVHITLLQTESCRSVQAAG